MKIKKTKVIIQEMKYLFIANSSNILISKNNEIFFIDINKYIEILSKKTIYNVTGILLKENIIGYSLYSTDNYR